MARAVSEFQNLLTDLNQEMQTRIARLVSMVRHLEQSELLGFITTAGPELVAPFLNAAADLTATWYEDQDPTSDFVADPVDLLTADDLAAAARWAMLQLDPITAWAGDAAKSLFDTSRQTVAVNAEREGIRWARHARPDACGFCRLLAVAGFHYTSEESALAVRHKDAAGHDHCNCTAVPERGSKDSTYPPEYLKQWKLDYEAARDLAGRKPGSIANAMDYLPGGRRYKGDDAPPHVPRSRQPVNLDKPATKSPKPAAEPKPVATESDAQVAKRLLPGLEKSLADLRSRGLAEDSPQIKYHLEQIARWKRALQKV